jgi:hypothetical protein
MKAQNPRLINDRTKSKNKSEILIPNNEKLTCLLIDTEVKETEMWSRKKPKNFKIETPFKRNRAYLECKNMRDDSNNRANWDHPKICQELYIRHVWNARYISRDYKRTRTHSVHISRKVLMWSYKKFIIQDNISCKFYFKYRTAVTLNTQKTWFVIIISLTTSGKDVIKVKMIKIIVNWSMLFACNS